MSLEQQTKDGLVTREQFDAELRALGEINPLVKRLISNEHSNFNFDKWPDHLKADAYKKLGLEPVTMYRRINALGCLEHLDLAGSACPECKEHVDPYGNTAYDFKYCSFPDCGCDGARLCMASEGPSDRSASGNVEGMWAGKTAEQIKARRALIVDTMLEKKS